MFRTERKVTRPFDPVHVHSLAGGQSAAVICGFPHFRAAALSHLMSRRTSMINKLQRGVYEAPRPPAKNLRHFLGGGICIVSQTAVCALRLISPSTSGGKQNESCAITEDREEKWELGGLGAS